MTLQCYAAASRGENFDVAESAPSELLGCELLMCPVLKKRKKDTGHMQRIQEKAM